jgi:hypothetical protein
MADSELRRWLKRQPHPVMVRACSPNGDERCVKIGVSNSRWRDAEEILEAYPKLEALDGSNNIMRVFNADDGNEAKEEPANAVVSDPETARLVTFAQLLATACDKAAARHEAAYKYAFDKLAELADILARREQAYEKAYAEALAATPQGEADPNAPFVQAALGLLMAKSAAPTPEKKPNGQ